MSTLRTEAEVSLAVHAFLRERNLERSFGWSQEAWRHALRTHKDHEPIDTFRDTILKYLLLEGPSGEDFMPLLMQWNALEQQDIPRGTYPFQPGKLRVKLSLDGLNNFSTSTPVIVMAENNRMVLSELAWPPADPEAIKKNMDGFPQKFGEAILTKVPGIIQVQSADVTTHRRLWVVPVRPYDDDSITPDIKLVTPPLNLGSRYRKEGCPTSRGIIREYQDGNVQRIVFEDWVLITTRGDDKEISNWLYYDYRLNPADVVKGVEAVTSRPHFWWIYR